MGKQKTRIVLIMQAMAKTDMPFTITKEGKNIIFADSEDLVVLFIRISRLVSGFKYVVSKEDKYFEITVDGEIGRIYLKNRHEYKRLT